MSAKQKQFCVIWNLNFTGEISLGQWDETNFWYVFADGDCYGLEGLNYHKNQMCTLAELQTVMSIGYRKSSESDTPSKRMPFNQFVARKEDMSKNGRLRLIKQEDGDICVAVITDEEEAGIEFCSVGSGGGKSPRTLAALNALAIAMQEDNEQEPSRAAVR